MLCLAAVSKCSQADLEGLRRAGREGSATSTELQSLASTATDRGQSAVDYSQQILATLQSFDNIDASLFVKIQDLVQRGQQEKNLYSEMDIISKKSMASAENMTETLQRGVDSLPAFLRQELQDEEASASRSVDTHGSNDEDEAVILQLLSRVDKDVSETQTMSRGVEQVDLFSAASKGKDVYSGVLDKKQDCLQMFAHIKGLSGKMTDLLQPFAGSNCCEQMTALWSGASGLYQCLRFSKLIQRALEAASSLIQAVIGFVNSAWDKFTGFLDEFDAAKRLGRFVSGIRPLKTKVGQTAIGMVGNMFSR